MEDEDDVFFGPSVRPGDEAGDGGSKEALAAQGQPRTFDDDSGHRAQLALRWLRAVPVKGWRVRKNILRRLQAVEHGPPRHMQARMAMQTKLNIVIFQSMMNGVRMVFEMSVMPDTKPKGLATNPGLTAPVSLHPKRIVRSRSR